MPSNPTLPRQPVLFIGHGSPMNAIEDNEVVRAWSALAAHVPAPRAILCISAHWQTRGSAVTAMETPRTIHDFRGFPEALFAVQYPAPGSAALAARVRELLAPVVLGADQSWGLDHGAWSVLVHLYPAADVPVVQLSMDVNLSAREHYELARQLAPLRDEGVLILGSGNIVHNLARMNWQPGALPAAWALEFDQWAAARITAADHAGLIDYPAAGDAARLSVPSDEHYLPLLYCLALQDTRDRVSYPVTGFAGGAISMRSVALTPG